MKLLELDFQNLNQHSLNIQKNVSKILNKDINQIWFIDSDKEEEFKNFALNIFNSNVLTKYKGIKYLEFKSLEWCFYKDDNENKEYAFIIAKDFNKWFDNLMNSNFETL